MNSLRGIFPRLTQVFIILRSALRIISIRFLTLFVRISMNLGVSLRLKNVWHNSFCNTWLFLWALPLRLIERFSLLNIFSMASICIRTSSGSSMASGSSVSLSSLSLSSSLSSSSSLFAMSTLLSAISGNLPLSGYSSVSVNPRMISLSLSSSRVTASKLLSRLSMVPG